MIGLALAGFAGLVFALFADIEIERVEAQVSGKRSVETAEAPKAVGPYSQAIIANGFVYTAGQIGSDPKPTFSYMSSCRLAYSSSRDCGRSAG